MTVKNDIVLWDNGIDKLCLLKVPNEQQYKYIDGTLPSRLEFLMKI